MLTLQLPILDVDANTTSRLSFVRMLQLLFLAVLHKYLLTVHTWHVAITLNYSVKKYETTYKMIIVILYEKSQFNSLVWGSLTLTQLRMC